MLARTRLRRIRVLEVSSWMYDFDMDGWYGRLDDTYGNAIQSWSDVGVSPGRQIDAVEYRDPIRPPSNTTSQTAEAAPHACIQRSVCHDSYSLQAGLQAAGPLRVGGRAVQASHMLTDVRVLTAELIAKDSAKLYIFSKRVGVF
jgi:hypothetical protein